MERIILADSEIQIESEHLKLYAKDFCRTSRDKPSRKLFNKFVQFNDYYESSESKQQKLFDDLEMLYGTKLRAVQSTVKEWCDALIADITDPEEIIKFIDLAESCGNNTMYTLAVLPMVQDMNSLTVDQFRSKYHIEQDQTEQELQQLDDENAIWKNISSAST